MASPEFTTEELANEIWKPLPEYEDYYEVSSLGRIKSLHTYHRSSPIILKPTPDSDGYIQHSVYRNRNAKKVKAHQLVTLTFLGECPQGMEVNHKNGIKADNRLSNLEYTTHQKNILHARDTGLHKFQKDPLKVRRGESCKASKLTENEVLAIRREYIPGVNGYVKLARKFGVTEGTIAMIIKRKCWIHI